MKFTVIGYQTYTAFETVYFDVEAETAEEALALAKSDPSECEIFSSDLINTENTINVELDGWEVVA